jgi:phenylacetate-CoA ligase
MIRRLWGSAVVAAALPGQSAVPFWPRERIEALRDRRLRRLVVYAAAHVPYYRELFRRERIDPRAIRRAADLERLPLLERERVRAEPERFVAASRAARGALQFTTSGSTATPLRVWHDQASVLRNMAYGERERRPIIAGTGGFRPKELYVGSADSTFTRVIAFYRDTTLLPVRPRRHWVSVLQPIDEIVALVNRERPDVIVGYGGWQDFFFKTVAARGLDLHRPKLVVYVAEALPPGARELIEGQFGIPVLSRYSAAECFKIGFYCEARTGFHLHEDLCHVRIVRDDGSTAGRGESGRVVLTNLVNRGSVLLNYPLGDVAAMPGGSCPCGRTFALLSELEGRVEDILALTDGRFVHPRAIFHVFKEDPDVLQYQLTQHELRRFELTLATLDDAAFARAWTRARPTLEVLLAPSPVIEARRATEISYEGGRKFRAVASRAVRAHSAKNGHGSAADQTP